MGRALKSFAQWRLQENMREYNFFFKKYKRLLMSMFEWSNLPNGISERYIEDKLFYNGIVVFFKSKELGFYVVSQCAMSGLNDYEEPTGYFASSTNRIHEYVKASECVPIWNDMFIEPNAGNVNFFAKRLSNIQKTFDVNLEQLKNPYIISCPEGQRETIKQVMRDKTDGVPYIFTTDDFGEMIKVNVFDLHIQNNTKALQDVMTVEENRGLTFFGVDNAPIAKRERVTTGENDSNNEQNWLNKNSMFKARKKACSLINEKFNLDVDVKISTNFEEELKRFKQMQEVTAKDGGGNIDEQ